MGQLLHTIDEHNRLVNRAPEKNYPANMIVCDLMFERSVCLAVLVEKSGVDSHREELADFLVQRHATQLIVCPFCCGDGSLAPIRSRLRRCIEPGSDRWLDQAHGRADG